MFGAWYAPYVTYTFGLINNHATKNAAPAAPAAMLKLTVGPSVAQV